MMDGRDNHESPDPQREHLVYVIDLTSPEIEDTRGATDDGDERRDEPPPSPPSPIDTVALFVDGLEEPVLLEIEPTRDGPMLDALARLLKIAVLAGERVPAVAVEYGESFERSLAFERRLPTWVYDGVDRDIAARLPEIVRRVLSPKQR